MTNLRLATPRIALVLTLVCLPAVAFAQTLEPGVDTAIAPGDDFFAFANGAWLRGTTIPDGRERWGVRNEIDDQTRRQLARLLDDAATAPAGCARIAS